MDIKHMLYIHHPPVFDCDLGDEPTFVFFFVFTFFLLQIVAHGAVERLVRTRVRVCGSR